jgi:hypothetical protein
MKLFKTVAGIVFVGVLVSPDCARAQPPDEKLRMDNAKAKPTKAALPEEATEIHNWARARIWNKEYDALEQGAATWRTSKAAYMNGNWKLTLFYQALGTLPNTPENDERWVSNTREWVKTMPESITARVALAVVLTGYAWNARGSGTASTVTENGWKLFRERLAEARLVLREAKTLKAKCPHWWLAAQVVARGQGWPLDAYDGLFKEAIAFEPDYFPFYSEKTVNLLPRWHGEEGAALQFSLGAANKMGGDKGDLLYARLIAFMYGSRPSLSPDPTIVSEKLDKGFLQWDKQYVNDAPIDVAIKAMWARYLWATAAPKDEAARKQGARRLITELEAIAPAADATWRGELKDVRLWAFGE